MCFLLDEESDRASLELAVLLFVEMINLGLESKLFAGICLDEEDGGILELDIAQRYGTAVGWYELARPLDYLLGQFDSGFGSSNPVPLSIYTQLLLSTGCTYFFSKLPS